jgi:large subunit ribosomal protein L17
MRHYKKGRKLGSDASHTKAIKKNLSVNLFANDRIKTTLERAKEIRGDIDRVITWAKRGDIHSRRLAIAKLGDQQLVGEVFAKVEQGLFKDRPGGYTRIYKVGKRRGDDAIIVIMELVQEPVSFKKDKDKREKDAEKEKPAAGKKSEKSEKSTGKSKKVADKDAVVDEDAAASEDTAVDEDAAASEDAAAEVETVEAAAEETAADEAAVTEATEDEAATDEAEVAEPAEAKEEPKA